MVNLKSLNTDRITNIFIILMRLTIPAEYKINDDDNNIKQKSVNIKSNEKS